MRDERKILKQGILSFSKGETQQGMFKQTRHAQVHETSGPERAGQCHCQATLSYIQKIMATEGAFGGQKASKYQS